LSYQPQAMFLTHYSRVMDVSRLGDDLHRLLDAFVAVAQAARGEGEERCAEIRAGLEEIIREEAERQVWPLPVEEALRVLHGDLELNAQGLAFWVDEQQRQAQEAAVAH
ncbi:MAG: MBL fold metallo-hydrolase, partial [Rhodocyclaceae bacterium]|nr:MBL fold metallo-hydrolase [Rhodocyclaceae bacterium]